MCRALNFLFQMATLLQLGCNHYSLYNSVLCRISFLNARCANYAFDRDRERWKKKKERQRGNDEKMEAGAEEKKEQSEKDLWNSGKEAPNISMPSLPGKEIPNLKRENKRKSVLLTAKYPVLDILGS